MAYYRCNLEHNCFSWFWTRNPIIACAFDYQLRQTPAFNCQCILSQTCRRMSAWHSVRKIVVYSHAREWCLMAGWPQMVSGLRRSINTLHYLTHVHILHKTRRCLSTHSAPRPSVQQARLISRACVRACLRECVCSYYKHACLSRCSTQRVYNGTKRCSYRNCSSWGCMSRAQ